MSVNGSRKLRSLFPGRCGNGILASFFSFVLNQYNKDNVCEMPFRINCAQSKQLMKGNLYCHTLEMGKIRGHRNHNFWGISSTDRVSAVST